MEHIQLIYEPGTSPNLRLDAYLAAHVSRGSRSYLKELIETGQVLVDGRAANPSCKPTPGQKIDLFWPEPQDPDILPEAVPLVIRYEDAWLLVVDKPQGMVVHPAPGHAAGTLVNALLAYCQGQLSDLNGVRRPGIVHRIDKDTSGLLLVVKDNAVHREIAERIRQHEIRRTYQALVHGQVEADSGTIIAPIGRDPANRQKMAVVASGKPAVTHFRVVERFDRATWLEVELETGRTHQIRVHCQYLGHPVIGDPVYARGYGSSGQKGQLLHASRLCFVHPVTGQAIEVTSPLPDYFLRALEQYR
jgi:23S rRNA pseudouridine1911/1915/1917 synthase